jgi:hypothetical protein
MRNESQSPTASPHWSESFVEHLRTVHFALTLLALAIIFTLASGKQFDSQKARTEASEILALTENWESNTSRLFDVVLARYKKESPISVELMLIKRKFEHTPQGPHQKKSFFIADDRRQLSVTSRELMSVAAWQQLAGKDQRPTTVAAFSAWWDRLHKGIDVPIPRINPGEMGHHCKIYVAELVVANSGPFPKESDDGLCYLQVEYGSYPEVDSKLETIECFPFTDRTDVDSCVLSARGLDPARTPFAFGLVADVAHIDEKIMKKFSADWSDGTFSEAFPDLASAVAKQIEFLDLKTLQERLNDGSKADQVIEAFGLKIAASDVTRWGILLLLATQFYFWLHLHELTRRIEPTDPGWNVAWIGIYQPWLAFTTVVVSVCALPWFAALLGASRLRFEQHPHAQRAASIVIIGVSAFLALATAWKLYKLRSRTRSGNREGGSSTSPTRSPHCLPKTK